MPSIERFDGRARRTASSSSDGHAAAGLSEGHAAAGDLLVLPARVPGSGRLRPARSHVQQEHASRRSARGRWSSSSASATRSSSPIRRSSARPGQMNNNYVHDLRNNLAAVDRRARSPRARRSHAAGDRRPQLRRVLGRQRHGPHAVLQGRHRRRRRLQPDADAARLPERAPRLCGRRRTSICRCRRSSTPTT